MCRSQFVFFFFLDPSFAVLKNNKHIAINGKSERMLCGNDTMRNAFYCYWVFLKGNV